jgi:hypothetical protein
MVDGLLVTLRLVTLLLVMLLLGWRLVMVWIGR